MLRPATRPLGSKPSIGRQRGRSTVPHDERPVRRDLRPHVGGIRRLVGGDEDVARRGASRVASSVSVAAPTNRRLACLFFGHGSGKNRCTAATCPGATRVGEELDGVARDHPEVGHAGGVGGREHPGDARGMHVDGEHVVLRVLPRVGDGGRAVAAARPRAPAERPARRPWRRPPARRAGTARTRTGRAGRGSAATGDRAAPSRCAPAAAGPGRRDRRCRRGRRHWSRAYDGKDGAERATAPPIERDAMSAFDDIKNKAKDIVDGHGDKVDEGIDKAGDLADERTGGQHGIADRAGRAEGARRPRLARRPERRPALSLR